MISKQKVSGNIGFGLVLLCFGLCAWKISTVQRKTSEYGENPGYFEQWFQEKKSADGTIPHWMRAKWQAWDRSQVRSRASEDILDTLYELGPKDIGGRTRAIWVDPRNDQVILAAAISGGVWRSENGGSSWKPLNDHEASLMPSCFTHSPFNPDIIYYGTGEGRANSADVDGNGVYRSTDGGKTFSVLPSTVGLAGFETIWDIKHSLTDSNTLYVGTNTRGLMRSTDGGQTWEQVLSVGSNRSTSIVLLPNNRVLVTMIGGVIYASDSAGKKGTFAGVTVSGWPTAGTYGRVQLANCMAYPNVVYALVEDASYGDPPIMFLKSSNGGRTWKIQTTPTAIGSGYANYCVMIGVNPADSNVIVTGGVSIAQSNNGGTSWSSKSTGHSDHHSFAGFSKTMTTYFLVGTDGGIYRYKYSSGAINATLNTGYQVTQFYAGAYGPEALVSISGAQDNGTTVATAILTSKKFYGADGAYSHIGLQDGSVAYLSTQNDGIRRISNFDPGTAPSFTDDIGDSRFITDGVNFINAYTINPADQTQLYYRTNKYLYRSANGGNTWDPITNLQSSMKAIGVSNESNPVVYVGGGAAQLYRIDNALNAAQGTEVSHNAAFPSSITGDFLNSIVVHPNDRNTVFVSFSNYSAEARVWRISGLDSSKPAFKNISGNLPAGLPVNFVAVDPAFPDKNIFAGTDFGLYYSTDSGNTWTKEMRLPNVAVHEIKMREDRTLFIYTHGRGMWVAPLTGSVGIKKTEPVAKANVYPNPTANYLQIDLQTAPVGATVSIYNSAGKLVVSSQLVNKNNRIDLQHLSNGLYFARIENQQKIQTTKILLKK